MPMSHKKNVWLILVNIGPMALGINVLFILLQISRLSEELLIRFCQHLVLYTKIKKNVASLVDDTSGYDAALYWLC